MTQELLVSSKKEKKEKKASQTVHAHFWGVIAPKLLNAEGFLGPTHTHYVFFFFIFLVKVSFIHNP